MTDLLMPWLSSPGKRPHFLPKPAPAPDPNNDVSIFTVASPSTPSSKPSDRSTSGVFRLLMRPYLRPNILISWLSSTAYTTVANVHEEHDDEVDIQASDMVKANLSTAPADIVYEVRSSTIS